MNVTESVAVYWDSSAILSCLFQDGFSKTALEWSRKEGYHFLSSLAWAEVVAVMSRIRRERLVADVLADAAMEALEEGPWRRLHLLPRWPQMKILSEKWPLRGADLWHLATAFAMKQERPEIVLLTFDNRLKAASAGEGLGT